jgi:hypothetical protein
VAQRVAQGALSEARPRLTPNSGLKRPCSPSRTETKSGRTEKSPVRCKVRRQRELSGAHPCRPATQDETSHQRQHQPYVAPPCSLAHMRTSTNTANLHRWEAALLLQSTFGLLHELRGVFYAGPSKLSVAATPLEIECSSDPTKQYGGE